VVRTFGGVRFFYFVSHDIPASRNNLLIAKDMELKVLLLGKLKGLEMEASSGLVLVSKPCHQDQIIAVTMKSVEWLAARRLWQEIEYVLWSVT
jgi:hypothetical protein